jgi:hypothetical protein
MEKKVLVIGPKCFDYSIIEDALKKCGYEITKSNEEANSLKEMLSIKPQLILCISESRFSKKIQRTYNRVKRRLSAEQRLIRLGFEDSVEKKDEEYFRLPCSSKELLYFIKYRGQ